MHVVVIDGEVVFVLLVFRKLRFHMSSLLEDSCVRKGHDNPLLERRVCHLFPKLYFLHMPIIPTHKWSVLLIECCHQLSPHWAVE